MAHGNGAPPDVGMVGITLCFANAARQVQTVVISLPAGATVQAAWQASGWADTLGPRLGQSGPEGLHLALWGRACPLDAVLQDEDRLELLRPLQADPMLARRQRLQRDGLRKSQRRTAAPGKKSKAV